MFYEFRSGEEEAVLRFLDEEPDTRLFLERTLAPVIIDLLGEDVVVTLGFSPAYDSFDDAGIRVILPLSGGQTYDRNRYGILDHITDDIPDNLTIGFY